MTKTDVGIIVTVVGLLFFIVVGAPYFGGDKTSVGPACEFPDNWRNEWSTHAYDRLQAKWYGSAARAAFINDFAAQDSDLIPLAECLWDWYEDRWWQGARGYE